MSYRAFLVLFNYFVAEIGEECNIKKDTCKKMQGSPNIQFLCASHAKPQDVFFGSVFVIVF
jgi:hypothetical protein